MPGSKSKEETASAPFAAVAALGGCALPPLTVAAIGLPVAAAALFLWKRSKSLKERYVHAKATLKQLQKERDIAVAQRDAAVRKALMMQDLLEDQTEVFASASREAKELSMKYEEVLMDAGELHARLCRADGFNKDLQQTIKKERRERAERESRILLLENRIEEQKAIIQKLQDDNRGPFTARSDDSADSGIHENIKPAQLTGPPASETDKRGASWPVTLPRPPVAFRDVAFRPQAVVDQ